jgi:hypothetical protein
MGTQTAQFDSFEHHRAAAQLDQIMLANRDRGWAACRDIMVEWHLAAVRTARADPPPYQVVVLSAILRSRKRSFASTNTECA